MILVTFSTICFQCSTTTSTMASTSQTNPAYDVPSFNAHDCLVTLHQEITNFLHYQLHVQCNVLVPATLGLRAELG